MSTLNLIERDQSSKYGCVIIRNVQPQKIIAKHMSDFENNVHHKNEQFSKVVYDEIPFDDSYDTNERERKKLTMNSSPGESEFITIHSVQQEVPEAAEPWNMVETCFMEESTEADLPGTSEGGQDSPGATEGPPGNNFPFMCPVCGKAYKKKKYLNVHATVHDREKQFSCDICSKTFNRKASLQSHAWMHTGEKPHACELCGNTFSLKHSLNKHMLIHTGEKPYACTFCGKSFNQSSALATHVRIHTEEKPFTCTVCDQTFGRRLALQQHHDTKHSRRQRYPCRFCHKMFLGKQYLKDHLLVHEGRIRFSCHICNKIFIRRGTLKTHLQLHASGKAVSRKGRPQIKTHIQTEKPFRFASLRRNTLKGDDDTILIEFD